MGFLVCTKCKETKTCELFAKRKDTPSGFRKECKECLRAAHQKYRAKNLDKIKAKQAEYWKLNKEKLASSNAEWKQKNAEAHKAQRRQYYLANSEKLKELANLNYQKNKEEKILAAKAYYQKNKERVSRRKTEWAKAKRAESLHFRLQATLRARLYEAIKNKQKRGSAIKDLGCSILELQTHLESQFQPGMTWENWTKDGWHIDHIRPLSSFDLTDPEQLRQACHYTNLQPLWAADNLSKGARFISA